MVPEKITGKVGKGGGLVGSIVAFMIQLWFIYNNWKIEANIILIFSSFFIGLLTIKRGEKYISQKWGMLKRHNQEVVCSDYNQTNIDEVHGQSIAGTVAFLFNITNFGQITFLIVSFILFRIFDTKKIWPIRNIEIKVKGSLGIMVDDTAGGIMALAVTLILIFIPYVVLDLI